MVFLSYCKRNMCQRVPDAVEYVNWIKKFEFYKSLGRVILGPLIDFISLCSVHFRIDFLVYSRYI